MDSFNNNSMIFINVRQSWTSVRLSVRLSVTRWYYVETAQPIVKLSSPPGSPMILVF